MVQGMKNGQVLLLENLRFHAGEEKNDPEFAHKLARLGADLHHRRLRHRSSQARFDLRRACSSMPDRGMGFLIEKELKFLDPLLHNPAKPFYAILGGSKVTDKIKTIESLMRTVDGLLIGGAMAHAFWHAQGDTIPAGAKQPKPEDVEAARALMRDAKKRELPLHRSRGHEPGLRHRPEDRRKNSAKRSRSAKTIFWNGPLGWFEKPEYAKGTFEVAQVRRRAFRRSRSWAAATRSRRSSKSGYADKFDHLSTGGGAVLEYLEGNGLPGIDSL